MTTPGSAAHQALGSTAWPPRPWHGRVGSRQRRGHTGCASTCRNVLHVLMNTCNSIDSVIHWREVEDQLEIEICNRPTHKSAGGAERLASPLKPEAVAVIVGARSRRLSTLCPHMHHICTSVSRSAKVAHFCPSEWRQRGSRQATNDRGVFK